MTAIRLEQPATTDQSWNLFAILGFCFSLFLWPLGFVFSPMALNQLKANPNQRGKGLAQAGLIISIVSTVFIVIIGVVYGLFLGSLFAEIDSLSAGI